MGSPHPMNSPASAITNPLAPEQANPVVARDI